MKKNYYKSKTVAIVSILLILFFLAEEYRKSNNEIQPTKEQVNSLATEEYKVTRIIDGDTVEVLNSKREKIRIRLAEIDCPERRQDFGTKATNFTKEAIHQKNVKIDIIDTDRYGRKIGKIYYDNDKYLSAELVRNGLAIVYREYSKSKELLALEKEAKSKKIGIWSNPNFVEPKVFRQKKG